MNADTPWSPTPDLDVGALDVGIKTRDSPGQATVFSTTLGFLGVGDGAMDTTLNSTRVIIRSSDHHHSQYPVSPVPARKFNQGTGC